MQLDYRTSRVSAAPQRRYGDCLQVPKTLPFGSPQVIESALLEMTQFDVPKTDVLFSANIPEVRLGGNS